MKNQKIEILYSDPVKEIMGRPPRKIIRWGTSVMFFVFALFIIFAWLIRYPDTIPAPVQITTMNPPVTLVTKITGHIRYLYVKEKEEVESGQILAVMETTANISEIKLLSETIDTLSNPEFLDTRLMPMLNELGELQELFASFIRSLSELNSYVENDSYGSKIISLSSEINSLSEYLKSLIVKDRLYTDNQKLEIRRFKRDSLLYIQKVIPESEYDFSHQSLIKNLIELQQVKLDQSEKRIEMAQKQQVLQDYKIMRVEERELLVAALRESFMNLKAGLSIWKNNYLLISPIDGVVAFTKFWSANQSVVKDEEVVNIIPFETGSFLGRINLKMQRSGKVTPGQMVNIKLSGYPYLEFGMVRGIIKSKSLVPTGDSYIIEIDLPDGLTTLYHKKLDFTQNMQGTAEIITDDIRLLQKVVNPFRYLASKNKR